MKGTALWAGAVQVGVEYCLLNGETMYQNGSVNLLNLLLSLSDALDLASPILSQHQMRTAFIVWEISKALELPDTIQEQLFIAALFHDVGALSPEEKINLHQPEAEDAEPHCILGEDFLKHVPLFEPSSKIVRFHHRPWQEWHSNRADPLMLQSQVLYLGDAVERLIDRDEYILHQEQSIIARVCSWSRQLVHPQVVEAFKSIAVREDFWFDIVSPRLYSLLLHEGPCRGTELAISDLITVSEMFRNLIDFRSPFTATHTSGVAATAAAISQLSGLAESEIELMEVAGNLHDLGKMAISNHIIEKPDKLTKREMAIMRQHSYFTYSVLNTIGGIPHVAEWAAFHHEKLSGTGYPFHINGDRISMGARIVAVADIFTALAENRPYRKAMQKKDVTTILTGFGRRQELDERVIDILLSNYDDIKEIVSRRQLEAQEAYRRKLMMSEPARIAC